MVENTYKESSEVWHTGFTCLRFTNFKKRKLVSLVVFLLRGTFSTSIFNHHCYIYLLYLYLFIHMLFNILLLSCNRMYIHNIHTYIYNIYIYTYIYIYERKLHDQFNGLKNTQVWHIEYSFSLFIQPS